MKLLSIIIPVYNEEKTISEILKKVKNAKTTLRKEIIIVNDGSTDNSANIIGKFMKNNKNFLLITKKNGGKGSAIREGLKKAKGDIILTQDADLEYNPNEYQKLIQPIINKKAKVVYGSRILNKNNKMSHLSFYIGGRLITFVTNMLYGSNLTDEPTGYKIFKSDIIKSLKIENNDFSWEPEITAKILKKGIKIYEVPISYNPRKTCEGKKINWKDGIKAVYTLIKYKLQ